MKEKNNSIDALGFSTRTSNALKRGDVYTIEELLELFHKFDERRFCRLFRTIGHVLYQEIKTKIDELYQTNFAQIDTINLELKKQELIERNVQIRSKIDEYNKAINALLAELERNQIKEIQINVIQEKNKQKK